MGQEQGLIFKAALFNLYILFIRSDSKLKDSRFMRETQNPDACVVMVTCGQLEEAQTIARSIVTENLAACVNLIGKNAPVRSFYQWEGKLQEEDEILLIIKTRFLLLDKLEKRIGELHSYSVFELVALPIQAGSEKYLNWIAGQTR